MEPFGSIIRRLRASRRPTRAVAPRLRVIDLEERLAPAVFNIPDGDIAALIAAINTSNTNNQADTINLAANGTYTFTAVATGETENALPKILRDTSDANTLTFNGGGATFIRSTAPGTPNFRFLQVGVFPNNITVTINNLNFTNGNAGTANGGALLLNAGDLTIIGGTFTGNLGAAGGALFTTTTSVAPRFVAVSNATFTNNSATNGAGGAIHNFGSSALTVTNSTFTGNTASAEGGAVRVQTSSATTTITRSTFAQNGANGGNGGGGVFIQGTTIVSDSTFRDNVSAVGGGGLWNQGALTVTGSTFSNNNANSSVGSGGGIFVQGNLILTNSTVHGNRAGNGGGVAYVTGGTTATVTHTTITNNQAFFGLASGGGVAINGANYSMGHTIVAGNTFATGITGTGPDIAGPVNSLGWNFVGISDGALITGTTTGNQVGTSVAPIDPLLGTLQNNGGLTFTRLPNAGSPVINAGNPAFAPPPSTDQRGTGFPRVQQGRIDIGAVEAGAPQVDLSVTKTDNRTTVLAGGTTNYTIVVANAGPNPAAGVTFTDAVPTGVSAFNWTSVATGGATGNTASGNGAISNTLTLPVGSSVTYTVTATIDPTATGTITNTAQVTAPASVTDTNPANNTAADTNTVTGGGGTAPATTILVGADAGAGPEVRRINPTTGQILASMFAYAPTFRGGVRIASADFNDDGINDFVTAPGVGGGAHIKVFNGRNGDVLTEFFAYDPGFRGGAYVAAADVTGDNVPDIITGAGESGGPHVRVFDGLTGQAVRDFFAYDPAFRGGVRVAAGQFDADVLADIVTGAGPGGGPHVLVYSGANGSVLQSFFAFDERFRGGVFVAAGDLTGDGVADIVTGPGTTGGAVLFVTNGNTGITFSIFAVPVRQSNSSFSADRIYASGVRVAVADFNGDGTTDIVTGPGPGRAPRILVINGTSVPNPPVSLLSSERDVFSPSFLGGIFVAPG